METDRINAMNTDGAIVYHRKPTQAFLLEICAVGFIGLGLWLVLGDLDGKGGTVARAAGIISILCFGLCAVLIGRQVMTKHPVYAINHDGFTLGAPGAEGGLFVDWKEVQGVGVAHIGDEKVLSFAFRDPDSIKVRMSPAHRTKAEENEASGVPILMIPQSALDASVDDIKNVSTKFFFAAG